MIESDLFRDLISNFRWNNPGQQIILSVPVELNPKSIEYLLAYLHGHQIVFAPDEDQTRAIQMLFIAATYFQVFPLVHSFRVSAQTGKIRIENNEFVEMRNFANELPKPKFQMTFTENINDLPSMKDVIRPQVQPQVGTVTPQMVGQSKYHGQGLRQAQSEFSESKGTNWQTPVEFAPPVVYQRHKQQNSNRF